MIICVSLNPAVDRRLTLDQLTVGTVNRARRAEAFPGGKAAHVAMAAQALGEEVIWVGFLGGRTGEHCAEGLSDLSIAVRLIPTRNETRTNLEIIDAGRGVTEVLEPGGVIASDELAAMTEVCEEIFRKHDSDGVVAFSGSLPPGVPDSYYADLIASARRSNCRALLDTSGAALRPALGAAPDLVKPNSVEAEQFSGRSLRDRRDVVRAIRSFSDAGARSVALSLGARGVVWQFDHASHSLHAKPPAVLINSTVGCGDATLAGFAVAMSRNLSDRETIRLATACGTANCLAAMPGGIERGEVERLMPLVEIEALDQFE